MSYHHSHSKQKKSNIDPQRSTPEIGSDFFPAVGCCWVSCSFAMYGLELDARSPWFSELICNSICHENEDYPFITSLLNALLRILKIIETIIYM